MSFKFSFPIVLNNKTIKLRELSFYEYKDICKSFFSQNNAKEINNTFNKILNCCILEQVPLNILEKIVLLINIRALTLGKEVKVNYDNKAINLDTSFLLSKLSYDKKPLDYTYDNMVLTFGLPCDFIINENDVVDCIVSSLISLKVEEKNIDVEGFTKEQKVLLLNSLPSIPLLDVYKAIIENCKSFNLTIPALGDFQLNLFDPSFLFFLKFIFDEKIETVMDLEYNLRRHLNMNSVDLATITYPESKIMLTKYAKEMKEKSAPEGGKPGNQA